MIKLIFIIFLLPLPSWQMKLKVQGKITLEGQVSRFMKKLQEGYVDSKFRGMQDMLQTIEREEPHENEFRNDGDRELRANKYHEMHANSEPGENDRHKDNNNEIDHNKAVEKKPQHKKVHKNEPKHNESRTTKHQNHISNLNDHQLGPKDTESELDSRSQEIRYNEPDLNKSHVNKYHHDDTNSNDTRLTESIHKANTDEPDRNEPRLTKYHDINSNKRQLKQSVHADVNSNNNNLEPFEKKSSEEIQPNKQSHKDPDNEIRNYDLNESSTKNNHKIRNEHNTRLNKPDHKKPYKEIYSNEPNHDEPRLSKHHHNRNRNYESNNPRTKQTHIEETESSNSRYDISSEEPDDTLPNHKKGFKHKKVLELTLNDDEGHQKSHRKRKTNQIDSQPKNPRVDAPRHKRHKDPQHHKAISEPEDNVRRNKSHSEWSLHNDPNHILPKEAVNLDDSELEIKDSKEKHVVSASSENQNTADDLKRKEKIEEKKKSQINKNNQTYYLKHLLKDLKEIFTQN